MPFVLNNSLYAQIWSKKMLACHINSTVLTTCGVEMDFGEVKNNQCQVT